MTIDIEPVPGPVGLPVLGNLMNIDAEVPTQSFYRLAEQYGELWPVGSLPSWLLLLADGPGDIYQMTFPGNNVFYVVSTHALVNECCDEKRFGKSLSKSLRVRFTAMSLFHHPTG